VTVQHKTFAHHSFLLLTQICEPYAITVMTRKWPKSSFRVPILICTMYDATNRYHSGYSGAVLQASGITFGRSEPLAEGEKHAKKAIRKVGN
jgi:hypothetical protein